MVAGTGSRTDLEVERARHARRVSPVARTLSDIRSEGGGMIAGTWRAATSSENADAYLEYLNDTGVSACEATPGNRGVYVLLRQKGLM